MQFSYLEIAECIEFLQNDEFLQNKCAFIFNTCMPSQQAWRATNQL